MKQIHRRAHMYAVAHERNGDGVGLMRAYTVGALEERKRMRVFVSGKVSGEEYYAAYGKFANADRMLSAMGYRVVNPMKICRRDWCWLRCMAKCLWALMFCDKMYQLPDWRESRGARIECRWAKFLNKRFV